MKLSQRKYFQFLIKTKNDSGIILLTVLWVLVILSSLAIGLSRATNIELALTKQAVGEIRAKYLAWGGLIYAVNQIRLDSEDKESNAWDTLYQCGISPSLNLPTEEVFATKTLKDGSFYIRYQERSEPLEAAVSSTEIGETYQKNVPVVNIIQKSTGTYYKDYIGLQDEERKLNINGLTPQNYPILSSLIEVLGFDDEIAETIALSILDWKDEDALPSDPAKGAEDDYYEEQDRPYKCKNAPFDSLEELRLVRGMTKEIFQALSDYLTIFPKDGAFQINFDTASPVVLKAVMRSLSGPVTNTSPGDADSLVGKLIEYRRGEDGLEFTSDDQVIEQDQMSLNSPERILFLVANQYRTKQSHYLRVRVTGVEENLKTVSTIDAVVQRDDLAIVAWRRY